MSFHHAFVTAVSDGGDTILLSIENAFHIDAKGDWTPCCGELSLHDVTERLVQGRRVASLKAAGDEGLIRRVWMRGGDLAECLITWRSHNPRRDIVRRYRIAHGGARWAAATSRRREEPAALARDRLHQECTAYRAWHAGVPPALRHNDWEDHYVGWPWLVRAVQHHLGAVVPTTWTAADADMLLYALGRNTDSGAIKRALITRPDHLRALARRGLACADADARWQLADGLGEILPGDAEADAIATTYAADDDDYVGRRALLTLGRRQAPRAEEFALRAWASGDEYRRMAALDVLAAIASAQLGDLIEAAQTDGRAQLAAFATELRNSNLSASS